MAIDWERLHTDIVTATVRAVNATLYMGEERALKDVPVRKVFRGGHQSVRFKTAGEIEADRGLRQRLGLAPEILATPEAVARVLAAGRNPKRGALIRGQTFGFARTINFPSSDPRRNAAGLTRAERGYTVNRRNRANDFSPGDIFPSLRQLAPEEEGRARRLADEGASRRLTGRGRYELKTGRAIHQRERQVPRIAEINARTGEVKSIEYATVRSGPEYLGGGLRGTIRVVKATPEQFPVIEGWLIAGDREHDYARYQELGTRHNAAHPFLRPRLPEWREELPAQLRRSLARTGR